MQKTNSSDSVKINSIITKFSEVRRVTENLAKPLEIEDYVIQATDDSSPVKWHLGHTSWFFDRFIIRKYMGKNTIKGKDVDFIFNSYYETLGKYLSKNMRGIMSRPLVKETYEYRNDVTQSVLDLLKSNTGKDPEFLKLVELGINHEQQHQELLLMDIKAASYINGGRIQYPAKKVRLRKEVHRNGFNSMAAQKKLAIPVMVSPLITRLQNIRCIWRTLSSRNFRFQMGNSWNSLRKGATVNQNFGFQKAGISFRLKTFLHHYTG
jgi:hypothetical protein